MRIDSIAGIENMNEDETSGAIYYIIKQDYFYNGVVGYYEVEISNNIKHNKSLLADSLTMLFGCAYAVNDTANGYKITLCNAESIALQIKRVINNNSVNTPLAKAAYHAILNCLDKINDKE